MEENKQIASTVQVTNLERNNYPTLDPREKYPDEHFDDHKYDDRYHDELCMSCSHLIRGICDAEQGICNYVPF